MFFEKQIQHWFLFTPLVSYLFYIINFMTLLLVKYSNLQYLSFLFHHKQYFCVETWNKSSHAEFQPATARSSTTAPRVPLTSRTTATKPSSTSITAPKTNLSSSRPKSVTEKQVKETANKLTAASKTVSKTTNYIQSLAKTTTATKRTEVSAFVTFFSKNHFG